MFRSSIPRSGMFRSIGLIGIALWLAPCNLWSQDISIGRPSSAGVSFAALDESLMTAADAFLDSAVLIAPAATGKTVSSTLANDDGQPTQRRRYSNVAALRLNLLRPIVEPILLSHGVPSGLSAMILIESGGQANALSPKGARGIWQLMPETARRYGLRVDQSQDDRVDPIRSTDAAARYLHDLYQRYGDWKLALAAYNTGEANVGNAIAKAHTENFDQLVRMGTLPLETSNYVPLVLAAIRSSGRPSLHVAEGKEIKSMTVFALSNH